MTERKILTLHRSNRVAREESPQAGSVFHKKVWANLTPKKQLHKTAPKQPAKEPADKTEQPEHKEKKKQKVKIAPKPSAPPVPSSSSTPSVSGKKWLSFKDAIIQLGALRYDKEGQIAGEVTQNDFDDNQRRLKNCINNASHTDHIDKKLKK